MASTFIMLTIAGIIGLLFLSNTLKTPSLTSFNPFSTEPNGNIPSTNTTNNQTKNNPESNIPDTLKTELTKQFTIPIWLFIIIILFIVINRH